MCVCVWGGVFHIHKHSISRGRGCTGNKGWSQRTEAGYPVQSTETQKVPIRLKVPHRKGLGQSENMAPLILQVIYFIATKVSA